jgi:hypothetical protein
LRVRTSFVSTITSPSSGVSRVDCRIGLIADDPGEEVA